MVIVLFTLVIRLILATWRLLIWLLVTSRRRSSLGLVLIILCLVLLFRMIIEIVSFLSDKIYWLWTWQCIGIGCWFLLFALMSFISILLWFSWSGCCPISIYFKMELLEYIISIFFMIINNVISFFRSIILRLVLVKVVAWTSRCISLFKWKFCIFSIAIGWLIWGWRLLNLRVFSVHVLGTTTRTFLKRFGCAFRSIGRLFVLFVTWVTFIYGWCGFKGFDIVIMRWWRFTLTFFVMSLLRHNSLHWCFVWVNFSCIIGSRCGIITATCRHWRLGWVIGVGIHFLLVISCRFSSVLLLVICSRLILLLFIARTSLLLLIIWGNCYWLRIIIIIVFIFIFVVFLFLVSVMLPRGLIVSTTWRSLLWLVLLSATIRRILLIISSVLIIWTSSSAWLITSIIRTISIITTLIVVWIIRTWNCRIG